MLCAVSLYNPGIGYCQGMSYVAAVLLMYVSPPEAFWLLNWMLQDLPNALGSYYTRSMSGVIRDSSLFAHMIGIHLPSLHRHLVRRPAAIHTTCMHVCRQAANHSLTLHDRSAMASTSSCMPRHGS